MLSDAICLQFTTDWIHIIKQNVCNRAHNNCTMLQSSLLIVNCCSDILCSPRLALSLFIYLYLYLQIFSLHSFTITFNLQIVNGFSNSLADTMVQFFAKTISLAFFAPHVSIWSFVSFFVKLFTPYLICCSSSIVYTKLG